MIRVCGADGERDALSRSLCWCRGLFCGRGGFKRTKEFRRDFRNPAVARSLEQFEELMGQQELFADADLRLKWFARIRPEKVRRYERSRTRSVS